jgi:hypothetical protein
MNVAVRGRMYTQHSASENSQPVMGRAGQALVPFIAVDADNHHGEHCERPAGEEDDDDQDRDDGIHEDQPISGVS